MSTDLETKSLDTLPINKELHRTTCALFFEWRDRSSCPITPPYTLKTQDHTLHGVTYKSMYLIYMNCASEYEAAIALLGHWPHWKKLSETSWFAPTLATWREEAAMKATAMATLVLQEQAQEGNVTAAKAIIAESKPVKLTKAASKKKSSTAAARQDMEAFLDATDNQGVMQ